MTTTDIPVWTKTVLLSAFLLFVAGSFYYLIGQPDLTNVLLLPALVLFAFGFWGLPKFKPFAYTMWIVVAVFAAMAYPQYFITAGDFELKKLIVPFVQLTMFGMGAHMSFDDFKGVVRMPKGVIIGLACHFTVMPLVGFALSQVFDFSPEIAGGVILIGCVPSAMASNVMSYLAKANLALAVTIGACSTLLSPFVTPVLMKWLGGQYVEVDIAHMMVDITNMIIIPIVAGFIFNLFYFGKESREARNLQLISFAVIILLTTTLAEYISGWTLSGFSGSLFNAFFWFYLLPMAAALLCRKVPGVSREKIESSLSFVAMLGIVINTLIITASGRDNLMHVGGLLVITCFLHNITGFGVGYFLAKILGLPERDRRTIAFEVGMQNGGVATGLAYKMGKVATVGLASAIFGPLQNVTGSILANWFRKRPTSN